MIPKTHHATLDITPPDVAAACAAVLPRLGKAVVETTGANGWNVLQNNGPVAGQVVHHVHFHIIPRNEADGLGFRWPAGKLDDEEAKKWVSRITAKL